MEFNERDAAPDGAWKSFLIGCYNDVAPTALRSEVFSGQGIQGSAYAHREEEDGEFRAGKGFRWKGSGFRRNWFERIK